MSVGGYVRLGVLALYPFGAYKSSVCYYLLEMIVWERSSSRWMKLRPMQVCPPTRLDHPCLGWPVRLREWGQAGRIGADLRIWGCPRALPAPPCDPTTDPAPRFAPRARRLDLVSGTDRGPRSSRTPTGQQYQVPLGPNWPPDLIAHPTHIAKRLPATLQPLSQ